MTRRGIWFPFSIKAKRKVIPPLLLFCVGDTTPFPFPPVSSSSEIFVSSASGQRFSKFPCLFFCGGGPGGLLDAVPKSVRIKTHTSISPFAMFFVMIVASPRERVRAGAPGISRADGRRPTTSSGFVWRAACVFRASLAGTCVAFRLSGCAKGVYIQ